MNQTALTLLIIFFSLSLAGQETPIIPKPASVKPLSGKSFTIKDTITIFYFQDDLFNEADYLKEYLNIQFKKKAFAIDPREIGKKATEFSFPDQSIALLINPKLKLDQYQLEIRSNLITISSGNSTGVFYGLQSLIQLIHHAKEHKIESMVITDEPRFEWRGMHLDVCRHFFSADFIKKYIDILAMHKMNIFHWHLTEDQGWRIEIKKYPKLTSVGAWRNGSMIGHYSEHKFDTLRYGGYYTQEQIKDIVKYADLRHITIVPEIEMPGHALAALASYPNLSCTGGPFEVAKQWGVFDDVYCAGNEETFGFLQDVLDEVCDLFPGKYIHIGGDECPKTRWEKCEKCQERMEQHHLKDEHELQSYFIQRIEKYLNKKGKQIIGWDEILEGGLAPNAAVMSWRGTEGGIAAAKQKHKVVMTPGSHCYFDHYQGEPRHETIAIGGFTTVEKVYSYEPVPSELSSEEAKYIMGAQGNVWTEYINTTEHVEYMAVPRMCALAEVLWTKKEMKNQESFENRLIDHLSILSNFKKIQYSGSSLNPSFQLLPYANGVSVIITKGIGKGTLSYEIKGINGNKVEIDGSHTTDEKIILDLSESCRIDAVYAIKNKFVRPLSQDINLSKSTSKKIKFNIEPSESYSHQKDFTLVNGVKAKLPRNNKEWTAWSGQNVEMTIDLNKKTWIEKVVVGHLKDEDNWIYLPSEITILVSKNGKKFSPMKSNSNSTERESTFKCKGKKTKFVKIVAKNPGKIPEGKPGAGKDSWLFFDEIEIY